MTCRRGGRGRGGRIIAASGKPLKKRIALSTVTLPGLVDPHDLGADRQFSMNLARGMEVLRAFGPGDALLGNREIADRTGLPKATVSRLTYTLMLLGYLGRVEGLQKYRLGSGVLSLAYPLLASMRIRHVARPHVEALARETGCTVNLGMRDRTGVVYLDTCRIDAGNSYRPDIGSSRPLLTTSIGHALLVATPPTERDAILNRLRVQDPARFARDRAAWEQDRKLFAKRGFCLALGSWQKEINAVGAPIRATRGEELTALNCTASAYLVDAAKLERTVAPRLLDAVRRIEMASGAIA